MQPCIRTTRCDARPCSGSNKLCSSSNRLYCSSAWLLQLQQLQGLQGLLGLQEYLGVPGGRCLECPNLGRPQEQRMLRTPHKQHMPSSSSSMLRCCLPRSQCFMCQQVTLPLTPIPAHPTHPFCMQTTCSVHNTSCFFRLIIPHTKYFLSHPACLTFLTFCSCRSSSSRRRCSWRHEASCWGSQQSNGDAYDLPDGRGPNAAHGVADSHDAAAQLRPESPCSINAPSCAPSECS